MGTKAFKITKIQLQIKKNKIEIYKHKFFFEFNEVLEEHMLPTAQERMVARSEPI
jgi:hypothetical protein